VCVFCGSRRGDDAAHAEAARALGAELVHRGLGLVFGGGSVGLMGVVADAVLAAGGEVVGVIPRGLFRAEIAHPRCTELHVVASMHERKALMTELADGFVALPGGLGTFEELLEVTTWLQLGIHRKPVGVLDVNGYWAGLRQLLAEAVCAGFLQADNAALILFEDAPARLLDRLAAWTPPHARVWLDSSET
jgi:uncharacterized protein (TIGR00730 family)